MCYKKSKVELIVYLQLIYLQLVIHETYVQLQGEEQRAHLREARQQERKEEVSRLKKSYVCF